MKDLIKRNKKILTVAIAIILILLIGIAYAYLRTTLEGQEEYVIRVGTLDLVLTEDNELTLGKQIPIEDSEGMSLNGFSFSLTNNGNIETDYTIYLDDIPLDEGETRMPDSAIRYSLTKNDEVFSAKNLTTMGSDPNRRVDFGTIGVDETINYTLRIWIDYDATTEEAGGKTFKGKLRVVATQPVGEEVSTVLLENIPEGNQYDDGTDTFITGEDPNNYIWYSGKLWRAVSINNDAKTTKLVTQWNISAINYSSGSTSFDGSYVKEWLNDETVDGFFGNLRDYENFIVTDAVWDATEDAASLGNIQKPSGTTTVNQAVGLLNMYEYQASNNGGTYGYLNNGLIWWTLTPYNSSYVRSVGYSGNNNNYSPTFSYGVRPAINLKSNVKIVDGDGTVDNPYRLKGDNDKTLTGTLLNTRYSGEYISFGNDENNLYRIVSHENGIGTKITSAGPLKNLGIFITSTLGSINYSNSTTMGVFLNGDYLTNYLEDNYSNMIEDSSIWYLGTVGSGASYKLAKYTNTNGTIVTSNTTQAKVGLLRYGELMTGQFERYILKGSSDSGTDLTTIYWTLTPQSDSTVQRVYNSGIMSSDSPWNSYGIRPSLNLKSNVVITGGTGTKSDPFVLTLDS